MSACVNDPKPFPLTDVSDPNRSGRIECYLHSDAITPNKGGALVKVTCDTDFAARTTEFCQFARSSAKLAYAASATNWADIVVAYPEMETQLARLREVLREHVEVTEVVVMKL